MLKIFDHLIAWMCIVIGLMFIASSFGLVQPPDEPRLLAAMAFYGFVLGGLRIRQQS